MSLLLPQAYAYCKRLTLRADSNFALSFRFLPKRKRDAIYAMYAFNRCADDFADETADSGSGTTKLERWEHMLNDCYRGTPGDHPVMIAFADAVRKFGIPKKPFEDALTGFRSDLSFDRYETFDDLKVYCDRVAGTISTISLHIFGYSDTKVFEYGDYLSYALQLTNIIRDVGRDIEYNRMYLPLDELKRFNYSEDDLFSRIENEKFFQLMTFQIQRARDYYKKAAPLIDLVAPDSRFTVIMIGAVYYQLLCKITEKKIPVLRDVVSLSKWEKLKIVMKMRGKPSFVAE